jgi:hypothetical protein
MSSNQPLREQSKSYWQALSFLMIVMSSIGLYYGVDSGESWITWLFMGIITLGMAIAIWRS